MKHTTAVIGEVKAIPRKRFWEKVGKSAAGIAIAGFSAYGASKWAWPYYVVLPVFGVGAHIFSEEWTRKGVKFVLAVFKDALRAVRGEKDAPPDDALQSGTHPKVEP